MIECLAWSFCLSGHKNQLLTCILLWITWLKYDSLAPDSLHSEADSPLQTALMSTRLPSVNLILNDPATAALRSSYGVLAVTEAIRIIQADQRTHADEVSNDEDLSPASYYPILRQWLEENRSADYRPVFNLTGVLLHSNLGRALIPEQVLSNVAATVSRPSTLEFDTRTGKRGHRDDVVKQRLCHLIGCESATFVNNNAAALLLVANTFAKGKVVVVSRTELIEIGGSFRLPEVIESAGCVLREVGTTNRVHLHDYSNALDEDVGLILKVHPSNYRIQGFTNEVATSDLARIARESHIPLAVDLGSGSLSNLDVYGLPNEPKPQQVLSHGADLVTFSGDKLLGGPQAGLVAGSDKLVGQLNRNPLKRALRLDKVTLALLNEILKIYEAPDDVAKTIPLYQALSTTERQLRHRARSIANLLATKLPNSEIDIEDSMCELGSGSLPETQFNSICVSISEKSHSKLDDLSKQLRNLSTPVIGRIHKNSIKLDMRGAERLTELLEILDELK